MKTKKKKYIELSMLRAMVYLPENAIEITLICTIYEDGKLKNVQKTLNAKDIQRAFYDAEMNYIEDDDMFYLTEKAEQELSKQEN